MSKGSLQESIWVGQLKHFGANILPPHALGAGLVDTGFHICPVGSPYCFDENPFYSDIPPLKNGNIYFVLLYIGDI